MKDSFKKIICGSIVALGLPVVCACGEKPLLSTPKEVSIDQTTNMITWQEVDNAEYYLVEINGKTYQTTSASFPAGDIINKGGKFYIRVLALDQDEDFLPSKYSEYISIENLFAFNTPVLSVSGNVLSWSGVGAEFYVVCINGVKFETTGTSLNLANLSDKMLSAVVMGKNNSFSVYAKATSNNLKSEMSNTISCYVASSQVAPTNVNVQKQGENIMLAFDAVATANDYTVKINNTEFVTEQTTLDITKYFADFGIYNISVKANKVEQLVQDELTLIYMESVYSSEFAYEHKPKFVQESVKNLAINDGLLTFDAITDATSYIVFINESEYQTNTNSYNLSSLSLSAGKYSVCVVAQNGNYTSLKSNETEYKVTKVLNTPSVYAMEQDEKIFAVISNIENATKYQLQVNEIIFYTTSLQVDITDYLVGGTNRISVIAVGDDDVYLNSAEGSTSYLLLGVPQNLKVENGVLSFDAVADSTSYEIYINDTPCSTTSSTSVDIATYISNPAVYQIKVRAISNNKKGKFANLQHITTATLASPSNLDVAVDNNTYTLSFSHDCQNVVNFEVYVNGGLVCQITTISVDITSYLSLGDNTIYVIAVGDGTVYFNSSASQTKTVTVTKTLDAVANLSVYAKTGDYYVSFGGVDDAESYKLEISNSNKEVVLTQTILSSELTNNSTEINISGAITKKDDYTIKVISQSSKNGVSDGTNTLVESLSNYTQTDYSNISYFYKGKDYTYCINSEQELKKFVFYAVLYRLDTAEVYINFDYAGKENAYSSADSLIQNMLPSISKYGVDINNGDVLGQLFKQENLQNLSEILGFIEEVHDQIYLYYDVTSNLTSQKSNCVYTLNFEYIGDYEATVSAVDTTYLATDNSSTRTFAIDSLPSAPVETVAQLLMVVQNGRQPEFVITDKTKDTLINGKSIAEQTYIKARQVLNEICTDSMTDYQKALAIYNWIVKTNKYDRGTFSSAEGAPFSSDNLSKMSFYASGMLLKKLSVCKGIAQAFALMCNIEGIKAIETFGIIGGGIDWANVDFKTMSLATYNLLMNIDTVGAHSWNRVYLDAGEGKQWYIVDATWESKINSDFSAHDWFLINDNAIKDNRKEFYPCGQFYFETDTDGNTIDFSANGSYNYYADTNIHALITSQTDLNNVVASMISKGGNGFEVIFDRSTIGDYSNMINQALTLNSLNYADYAVYKKDNYVLVYKK